MSESSREKLSSDLLLLGSSLAAVGGVLAIDLLGPALPGTGLLRTLVGGAFLLFAPGYAMTAFLFPQQDQLSLLERVTLSVGASLALVALLGIPLDRTPWGITLWTVLIEQAVLVLVLIPAAHYRRSRLPPEERADPLEAGRELARRAWTNRSAIGGGSRVVQVLLIVAVLASVGATAYTVATPLPSEQYTEFSVLGPDGTVDGLPENATAGAEVPLLVGIHNNEHETQTYGLQVTLNTTDGERVVQTDSIQLAHGDRSQQQIQVQMPEESGLVRVQIRLFLGEAPGTPVKQDSAYRSTRVVIDVRADGQ